MTDRDLFIHMARIYLREARIRARIPVQRGFCFALIKWAGDARRRAMQCVPAQDDLF